MFVLWGGQGSCTTALCTMHWLGMGVYNRAISCPVVGGVGGGGHDEITNKNINCL